MDDMDMTWMFWFLSLKTRFLAMPSKCLQWIQARRNGFIALAPASPHRCRENMWKLRAAIFASQFDKKLTRWDLTRSLRYLIQSEDKNLLPVLAEQVVFSETIPKQEAATTRGPIFQHICEQRLQVFFSISLALPILRFQANPFQSNEQKQLFVSSLQIFHIFRISFSSRSSPIWSVATASWWKTSSSIPPCFMLCSWFCRFFCCLTLTLFLHVFPHLSGEVVRCC